MLFAVGCGEDGPPLAAVEGTVTLDGQPLPAALIEFQPKAPEGSPSYGETDAEGRYQLLFSQSLNGAWIGEHRVRITTLNENQRIAEKLPPEYHRRSQLVRVVEAGKTNVFDFAIELKSTDAAEPAR
jgi:hypothetical protein